MVDALEASGSSWSQVVFPKAAKALALVGPLCCLMPHVSQADQLRLVDRADGNEVEVLEEREDAFVVKIPKNEVAMMVRKTPTEIKLWKERKILWQDQGDYLVISLPRERIVPAPTTAEGLPTYATTATLEEGLSATGIKGQPSVIGALSGEVTGRVLRQGQPLAGCRVKLTAIQGPASELTRLLGRKGSEGSGPRAVESMTGEDGIYRFEEVPIGDYDISWLPAGSTHWLGWLSDKPDVTVRAGEITQQGDIEL